MPPRRRPSSLLARAVRLGLSGCDADNVGHDSGIAEETGTDRHGQFFTRRKPLVGILRQTPVDCSCCGGHQIRHELVERKWLIFTMHPQELGQGARRAGSNIIRLLMGLVLGNVSGLRFIATVVFESGSLTKKPGAPATGYGALRTERAARRRHPLAGARGSHGASGAKTS